MYLASISISYCVAGERGHAWYSKHGDIPWQERQQVTMVSFNLFIELILSVVELLADSATREAPDGRMAANLVLVGNQFDRLQRLLGCPLVLMNIIFLVL